MTVNISDNTKISGAEGKELIAPPITKSGLPDMETVSEILTNLQPSQALLIRGKSGTIMPKSIFEQIKDQDKTVVFAVLDENGKTVARFVFNGMTITNPMDFNNTFSNTPVNASASAFPQGAKLVFLNFGHNGALPGKATVSVLSSPTLPSGTSTHLYYLNGTKYDFLSTQEVLSTQYCSFVLEHCSEYVLSDVKISEPGSEPINPGGGGADNVSGTAAAKTVPKTSDDSNMMLWIVVMGAGIFIAAFAKTRTSR